MGKYIPVEELTTPGQLVICPLPHLSAIQHPESLLHITCRKKDKTKMQGAPKESETRRPRRLSNSKPRIIMIAATVPHLTQ
jgi:hypothetical protein